MEKQISKETRKNGWLDRRVGGAGGVGVEGRDLGLDCGGGREKWLLFIVKHKPASLGQKSVKKLWRFLYRLTFVVD